MNWLFPNDSLVPLCMCTLKCFRCCQYVDILLCSLWQNMQTACLNCDWTVFTCCSLQKHTWCVFLPITYGNCHSCVGFFSTPYKRAGNFSPKYLCNFHLIWNHMGIRITLDHCLPRFSPPPLFVLLSAAFAHTPLSS